MGKESIKQTKDNWQAHLWIVGLGIDLYPSLNVHHEEKILH